ncbi:MAG: hypothetical protein JSU80_01665 [Deltaproteobacteria bacterium]|nr:MAG: hypothetical protein JSU80_01665 [Deltaproteobacteria bacterium]
MKKRTPFLLISTLVLLAIFVGLLVWQWDTLIEKVAGEKIEEERHGWMERTQELESIILELQQGKEFKPLLPAERLSQVFGPTSPLVKGASPRSMKCEELEDSLRAFCRYLDAGETFRSQKTHRDSWALFTSILESLVRRPPVMSAESYRPSVIVENSFYFFRLLGKEKIDIVREVIKFESDLAEPLMGIMYYWLMTGRSCDKLPSPSAALKIIYNYAGFFLDTLGGHSYLYRQDSRIRLLTVYYSILVIHEANMRELNEVGLDLRYFLPNIFQEIQSRNDLLYAEDYLQTLTNLQLQYFRLE